MSLKVKNEREEKNDDPARSDHRRHAGRCWGVRLYVPALRTVRDRAHQRHGPLQGVDRRLRPLGRDRLCCAARFTDGGQIHTDGADRDRRRAGMGLVRRIRALSAGEYPRFGGHSAHDAADRPADPESFSP